MATFWTIIQDIRKNSYTERDKGNRFERLICNYLKTSKKYNILLDRVWLWSEFPYRKEFGGTDTGIDLVALTTDGKYWAIQCKCYADDTVINKAAVDTFLATSSRQFTDDKMEKQGFSSRLWFATNNKWGKNAKEAFENQNPPAYIINPWEVTEDETVDWEELDSGLYGENAVKKRKIAPKPHQQEALKKAAEYYKNHDRGKLIMACGTGKTYTSLCLAEQQTDGRGLILVLVPSIALINQTLNEWQSCAKHDIYPICVCSDSTASRLKDNDDVNNPVDLAMPASTNYRSVAEQLLNAKKQMEGKQGLIVVYSTYQSIDVIGKAQKYLRGEFEDAQAELLKDFTPNKDDFTFDYIICDEAHRTTGATIAGDEEKAFVKVHYNSNVAGKHRLYMTATPRLYTESAKKKAEENDVELCSMDDINKYGEEIYRIGFGEAVEKDLLSDYKVLILTVRESTQLPADLLQAVQDKNQEINADEAVKLVGVINALSKRVVPDPDIVKSVDPALMHRAVAFCSKIKVSKVIANSFTDFGKSIQENFQEDAQEDTVIATAKHIDGSMNANERNELVNWLRNAPTDGNECRILTNVRCLSEGVDVPSLDAVIFLSKSNSPVGVVQSVGRVMRKAPGKKYGYIIIPVIIPDEGDPNTILDNNDDYAVIWTVLNALRAHDDRFNAFVNKLELNDNPPTGGGTAVVGGGDGTYGGEGTSIDGGVPFDPTQLVLFDDGIRKAIYAKMVLKVGTKRYWEQWADDIAKIANKHIERIKAAIENSDDYKTGFEKYMYGLHKNINPNITDQSAIEMLAQHFIAKPVFDALFENYSFVDSNPVSKSMKKLLDKMQDDAFDKEQQAVMERFYKSVKERCEGIDNASGKQRVIIELYDKFFKKALAKTVEKLGIVYTPVEVVDFINKSVADVLKKEFNRSISDENIHVIDPFTGTGTFITRILQSGLIRPQDMERKYKHELHANEIVLLAYYIASINIENAFHDMARQEAGNYTPFDGICLTDTFQLYEDKDNDVEQLDFKDFFAHNSERVIAQSKVPMRVIIGNPPYSIGQNSANDDAQNEHYPKLENRITETYGKESKATLQKGLYDSYIKAFRYASDRLEDMGGVIGFVTNAGWLDGNAMDGLRKCFEKEFSSIYVYNLKGNQRTSGETSRREGGKIFGSGSRAPIAITILVKNPKAKQEKATIYYREVDDYLTREEKLAAIVKQKSVLGKGFTQKILQPNEEADWLNQRSDIFGYYTVLYEKKSNLNRTIFNKCAPGIVTSRDSWVYNFSEEQCKTNINNMLFNYNLILTDNSKLSLLNNKQNISWSVKLKERLKKKIRLSYNHTDIINSNYRPFCKCYCYYNKDLIERPSKFLNLICKENILIQVSGTGNNKEFSVLITKMLSDFQCQFNTQCFPLYWYEENIQQNIFATTDKEQQKKYIRHDGITDYILQEAREKYRTNAIKKEDIFYYVYGFLHSEDYRRQFAADLKKMLPRLPLVDTAVDFKAFSEAGRKLADLHLNYEKRPKPEQVVVERNGEDYSVEKMKFKSKQDKSVIVYNKHITIKNIPLEAYEYVVNGKSAIEWIIDRYQVRIDKASQIKNDPNDWAKEHNDPTYILDLLLSIITVSLETMKIVKALPHVKFE